jgi:TolB-like protein
MATLGPLWPTLSLYDRRMTTTAKRDSLRSWKAIAAYLGCSVRSARRWEVEEGLPVHRQMHKSQGTVYAYADELDAWQKRGETRPAPAARSEPDRSIAVLPLSYVGPDPANEYIADGFTDEIIADLSKIRALRVISRTSSMALKGTRKDARSIARSLNVRFLLEGTVRQQQSTLRISTRLIDPASDDRLWSSNYDGNIDEVFAIQEKIARDVAGALHLQLTVDDDQRLSERKVDDVAAWRYALEARQQALRWRPDSIDQAISLLQKAVEIAGEVPALLGALGRAWLHYREAGIDTGPEPLRQAEGCRDRIAAIDSDAAAGLQLAGWIAYSRGDLKAAVRYLNLAIRKEPNDPDTLGLLANCYILSGRTALARPVIERHLAIDPLTPLTRCLPGFADAFEGHFSRAIGPYREMYEADPGNPFGRLFLIWILASAGERDEALGLVGAALKPRPRRTHRLQTSRGSRAAPTAETFRHRTAPCRSGFEAATAARTHRLQPVAAREPLLQQTRSGIEQCLVGAALKPRLRRAHRLRTSRGSRAAPTAEAFRHRNSAL